MALIVMIIRKMIKNKWLELSLLLGLILSVALVSSMPIYTNSILHRMLIKDLENLQENTNQYPGTFWTSAFFGDYNHAKITESVRSTDEYMQKKAKSLFSIPIQQYVQERVTDKYIFAPLDPTKVDARVRRVFEIGALSNMDKNIKLVDGRMPAKEPVNGVYEALVVEQALNKNKMVLGNEFVINDKSVKKKIVIKPVGVFEKKKLDSLYWYSGNLSIYDSSFLINYDLFEKDFTSSKVLPVRYGYWYYALDYTKMNLNNIYDFVNANEKVDSYFFDHFKNYSVKANSINTISKYFDREEKLRVVLWSLNVPVMIMLAFYLFMVANLITDRQKTEIAVLRSRGAGRWQILSAYVIEGLILGFIAFLIGPQIGMLFTKILGASNGFLEFVQRSALEAKADGEAYRYALIAVLSSLVMTLIPAFIATKATIVGHKQKMARKQSASFWHKFFIDIILIGISIYGLESYRRRMNDLLSLGLDSNDFKIDPLLFLVPALFILGLGLFILRIYPLFIRLFYWIGKKWWPPSLYSTLIQVGRSSTQYQFLMVFLIITISTGLFSASAARTMNKNVEEKIRYKNGSEIVLNVHWDSDSSASSRGSSPAAGAGNGDGKSNDPAVSKRVQYTEPPYEPIAHLPGVESAAKVFVKPAAYLTSGKKSATVELMGIDTDDFGRTIWFKDGLLDHRIYDYLNLIAPEPSSVLISKTLADQRGLKVGDYIQLSWDELQPKTFIVYGIVDYFPSFNPNKDTSKEENKDAAPMLVVGHLQFIQNNLALEPYQVWMKLKPELDAKKKLYQAIGEKRIPVVDFKDTREELRLAKNDPFQLAINGVMTLGFLISIIISFFGFLLYWILSLNSRILQLGIFRAMGISFVQLIGMLVTEQLLTSGAAILIGVLTGNVTGRLFVPLFQISFNPTSQVPPFEVTFDPRDSMQLYIIVSFMIILGLIILGYLLSRIKIHQAVKLGED